MGNPKPKSLPLVVVTIREGRPSPAQQAAWARFWTVILSENEKPPVATGGAEQNVPAPGRDDPGSGGVGDEELKPPTR